MAKHARDLSAHRRSPSLHRLQRGDQNRQADGDEIDPGDGDDHVTGDNDALVEYMAQQVAEHQILLVGSRLELVAGHDAADARALPPTKWYGGHGPGKSKRKTCVSCSRTMLVRER